VDSRSSDAIALAVRLSVPIMAVENVMDQAAVTPSTNLENGEPESAEDLSVFRDFVEGLDIDESEAEGQS
jgi:hypothetical protein